MTRLSLFLAAALTIAACLKVATVKAPEPIPARITMPAYAWLRGTGAPFVKAETTFSAIRQRSGVDSVSASPRHEWAVIHVGRAFGSFTVATVIDTAKVRRFSRFHIATLEPAKSGVCLDILRLARTNMGRRRLLAFAQSGAWYACGDNWKPGDPIPYGCDTSATNFAWSRIRAIRAWDAVLWNTAGEPHRGGIVGSGGLVDWARPGVAVALADTIAAWTAGPSLFDGAFCDQLWRTIHWTDNATSRIDYRRSGYRSLAAWDSAYSAGVETFLRRLRKRLPGSIIGANFGGAGQASGFILPQLVDFAMWENYPYQHSVTVADFLAADSTYRMGVWLTAWSRGDTSSAESKRRHRYVAGVAMLGNRGFGGLTGCPEDQARGFVDWWPTLGVSPGRPLGVARPLRPGMRVWVREFERGTITVDEAKESVTWQGR